MMSILLSIVTYTSGDNRGTGASVTVGGGEKKQVAHDETSRPGIRHETT
jgi:hypothetical protein